MNVSEVIKILQKYKPNDHVILNDGSSKNCLEIVDISKKQVTGYYGAIGPEDFPHVIITGEKSINQLELT